MDEMTHTDRVRPTRKFSQRFGDRGLNIEHSTLRKQGSARPRDLLGERTGVADGVAVEVEVLRVCASLPDEDSRRRGTHADRDSCRVVVTCGGDQSLDV